MWPIRSSGQYLSLRGRHRWRADGQTAPRLSQQRPGAAHSLRETVGRVRYAGATGPHTVRADSGFHTCAIVAARSKMDIRYSTTVGQHARLGVSSRPYHRRSGRPSPAGWKAPPLWSKPRTLPSRMSPTPYRCVSSPPGVTPRLPTWSFRQPHLSRLHHRPGVRQPGSGGRPLPPRRSGGRRPRPEVRRRSQPSPLGPFPLPTPPGWRCRLSPIRQRRSPLDWAHRSGRGFFSLAGRITRKARRLTLHLPRAGPGRATSAGPWPICAPCRSVPDCETPRPLSR